MAKPFKVILRNSEDFKRVQERAFELNYHWQDGQRQLKRKNYTPYALVFYPDGRLIVIQKKRLFGSSELYPSAKKITVARFFRVNKKKRKRRKVGRKKMKEIVRISCDGEKRVFKNIHEVIKSVRVEFPRAEPNKIYAAINKRQLTAYNYRWEYQ
jgi:hypothetical protein